MSISEQLIADFRRELKLTRRLLEAAPEEQFGWKPHERSMTLGQLVGHIVETPSWGPSMMEKEFDFAVDGASYVPFVPSSHGELMASFDKNAEILLGVLEGKDDATLGETWTMRSGDMVMMQQPRHEVVRDMTLHHVAHHRGQLTVYLRLLEIKVPGIYGPSADDKQ